MQKFSKKDLFFSVLTGLYAGAIAWRIAVFLNLEIYRFGLHLGGAYMGCFDDPLGSICIPNPAGLSWVWLMAIVPICWIIGVNLGYFLGRWMPVFNQFGRFAVVGFTNFVVYSGILNLLIGLSSINKGTMYSIFVGISFIVGMLHSFALNKNWVFEAGAGGGGAEFGKFLTVSVIAGLVNVAVATFIVNFIHPLLGISANGWANVGGISGSAVALLFSFVGFKLLVFKGVNKQVSL